MEPTIHRLSESLIRKIAAGEVVERPASVVKELVENSLDAQARRVRIDTGAAGRQLLRVTDDGTGMVGADALLCVERHTTSKMSQPSDLFAITTLGFRGEALASICAVARVCIETRSAREEAGTRLVVEGGVQRSLASCGRAPGTTIEVRDLFFNTPARRKFLRQDSTEQRHIVRAVVQLAAARPEAGLQLFEDDRQVLDLLPGTPRSRAAELMGVDAETLLELDRAEGGVRVTGYLAAADRPPSAAQGSQFVVVRGRPVYARPIAHAVTVGYGGLLASDAQAAFVLWLELDPALLDVNVHPTKREVRFADERAIAEAVEAAVRGAIRGPAAPRWGGGVGEGDRPGGASLAGDGGQTPPRLCLVDEGGAGPAIAPAGGNAPPGPGPEESAFLTPVPDAAGADPEQAILGLAPALAEPGRALGPGSGGLDLEVAGANRRAWQLHGEFILLQAADGLLLVDQRAAHERVLYERVLAQMAVGCPSQQLLLPVALRLSPAERHAVQSAAAELAAAGFGLREFGSDTVLMDAAPADLASGTEEAVLRRILADLVVPAVAGAAAVDRRQTLARGYARGAALARGQRLHDDTVNRLVDDLARAAEPFRALDGGPIVVRIGLRQIRQFFDRQRGSRRPEASLGE